MKKLTADAHRPWVLRGAAQIASAKNWSNKKKRGLARRIGENRDGNLQTTRQGLIFREPGSTNRLRIRLGEEDRSPRRAGRSALASAKETIGERGVPPHDSEEKPGPKKIVTLKTQIGGGELS